MRRNSAPRQMRRCRHHTGLPRHHPVARRPSCRGDRLASDDEVLLGLTPRRCHRVSILREILHCHLRFQSGRELTVEGLTTLDLTELLAIGQHFDWVLATADKIELV